MRPNSVLEPGSPPRSRRFNLMDAMIWTAAAAFALMPSVDFLLHFPDALLAWIGWIGHLSRRRVSLALVGRDVGSMLAHHVLNYASVLLGNTLVGMTFAVIWSRIRRPRPTWPTIARQPGFVACVAAPAGFLVFLEANYLGAHFRPELAIGGAVATAWLLLAVGRRWAAERSWIDRLGRLAGVGWLLVALIDRLGRSVG